VTATLVSASDIISPTTGQTVFTVAEFFAGIGLARLGLERGGTGFKVTWANDLDDQKRDMYRRHFADAEDHYVLRDIREIAKDISSPGAPHNVDLAWASFPCTDLSLAGGRSGLDGQHSSTFWDFTAVVKAMGERSRGKQPKVIALENVNGFATSHQGKDMKAAIERLNELGYWVDIITLDARRFVPQSRPRLFVIASNGPRPRADERRNTELRPSWLDPVLDADGLRTHRSRLPDPPPPLETGWTDLVDDRDPDVEWWDEKRIEKFKDQLSTVNKARVDQLSRGSNPSYRTAYRRTRNGVPAWEIRNDDIAGCLRTARGGSSKQAVVRMQKDQPLRVRWMTAREYAKLMGAPDYILPTNPNRAIMGFGDAVCVDAVSWIANNYLHPLLSGTFDKELTAGEQTMLP
jgi:DNA (cytosine-5)-methyltransferase 1